MRDEVYRQMIRLEAGCPQAELELALALLHAWMRLHASFSKDEQFQWLRKVCPACFAMIRTTHPGQAGYKPTAD